MKISKNIIIPVTAILILGLYLIFNSTGKMNYKIPEFNTIESGTINSIQIKSEKGTIKLYSDNDIWKLNPDNFRAEFSKIEKMLAFLENPQFIDMVSDTKNYQNYGLEENKYIEIKANIKENTNNDTVRELYLGDYNDSKSFAFIRKPDNKSVFTVKENIKQLFDVSENDLLDKRVTRFEIPEIERIKLSFLDLKFFLIKSVGDNNNDIWTTSNGSSIKLEMLEQNLRYLSNSRFNAYIINNDLNKQKAIFAIELSGKNLNESFRIFQKNDSDYLCISTFTNKKFLLPENTGTQIIKMFNELLDIKE